LRKGLLERYHDLRDRKLVYVRLAPPGKAALKMFLDELANEIGKLRGEPSNGS
jgi:DNA-binding MarR family transcriptional regulator